ncbi:MAG: DUF1302 family protein [Campylobacterota bacterium]|nr:DUF1302 family protein [Campylobacterota bacterium]
MRNEELGIRNLGKRYTITFLSLVLATQLYAESTQEALEGFDDTPVNIVQVEENATDVMEGFDDESLSETTEEKTEFIEGLTGKVTEQLAYSYNGNSPHDKLTSLKSSLFLDYEHKFENGWRVKSNAKAYYDAVYDIRDESYSKNELKEQRSEVELFDAYVEGSITDSLDVKIGRQVLVWGRSDTIRITDVLNPLDNRRPGMVDIEDLRLPVGMVKFDYFMGDWRLTPTVVVEQRFSKNPAFGSAFNALENPHLKEADVDDITYALSLGGEFSGWDVNFYAAHLYDDEGYLKFAPERLEKPQLVHEKITMLGSAFNVLSGAWLFKTELAYFDGLKYTTTQEKEFSRLDGLIGFEYKGIADTTISYDASVRHIENYDATLLQERNPLEANTYQHAFRATSDFMNATLTANYLISLYGKKLDEGGFQRLWAKYELGEGVNLNVGVIDYIGGSTLFNSVKDNDMVFADISYSF